MERLGRPYMLDSILAPINSGFAASLARYVEVRRRHPEAELFMGIGNLTELTEADSAGVTALLIGFCQEVGIRAVLTTEVIDWARGAVREAVLAAQIMHLAQRQGAPAQAHRRRAHHEQGRGDALAPARTSCARCTSRSPIRTTASTPTPTGSTTFNRDRFLRETNMYRVFEQLDVDDPGHAFYLGKELMKATIARGLQKSYRQEGPLDWGYLSFPEPRREDPS